MPSSDVVEHRASRPSRPLPPMTARKARPCAPSSKQRARHCIRRPPVGGPPLSAHERIRPAAAASARSLVVNAETLPRARYFDGGRVGADLSRCNGARSFPWGPLRALYSGLGERIADATNLSNQRHEYLSSRKPAVTSFHRRTRSEQLRPRTIRLDAVARRSARKGGCDRELTIGHLTRAPTQSFFRLVGRGDDVGEDERLPPRGGPRNSPMRRIGVAPPSADWLPRAARQIRGEAVGPGVGSRTRAGRCSIGRAEAQPQASP